MELAEKKEAILKIAASGGYMQTWNGKRIYLDTDKFNVADVLVADVAHHLPSVNRYAGATAYPYSVAQHCTALARSFRRRWQDFVTFDAESRREIARLMRCEKQAFLHDWTEYVTNDLLAPFKQMMPQIKALDETMINALLVRNGVGPELDLEVVEMDRRMCRNEMDVMGSPNVPRWWDALDPVPGVDPHDLREMSVPEVRKEFLEYAVLLGVR